MSLALGFPITSLICRDHCGPLICFAGYQLFLSLPALWWQALVLFGYPKIALYWVSWALLEVPLGFFGMTGDSRISGPNLVSEGAGLVC